MFSPNITKQSRSHFANSIAPVWVLQEAPGYSKSSYNAIQNCHAVAHVEGVSSQFPKEKHIKKEN